MKNLIETAIAVGNFKMLMNALQEAGLVDALSNEGPFTIFAPNDEAFSKLPSGALEKFIKNIERLTEILTYHILENKVMSKQVIKIKNAKTFNGKELSIKTSRGLKIDNANVIRTDIECSNGVIHVIDEVLIPD
jgi:uncharacterized surface protein with fasciclin (FAS1) repeats